MSAPWGSVRLRWWPHYTSHLPPSVSTFQSDIAWAALQLVTCDHVIWSVWGSHETWDTLSKLFPVHKIYDPKVAFPSQSACDKFPENFSEETLLLAFSHHVYVSVKFSSYSSASQIKWQHIENKWPGPCDSPDVPTAWLWLISLSLDCCSLDPPWQGSSWLAVPVSLSAPRGAGLSSLSGAPLWPVS